MGRRGLAPRSPVLQTGAILRPAHGPLVFSSTPDRARTDLLRLKGGDPDHLDDGGEAEPTSGIEPDPPVYEAGARPIELRGQCRHPSGESLFCRLGVGRLYQLDYGCTGSTRLDSNQHYLMRVGPLRADDEAPVEGIEPPKRTVNSRLPVHSASPERNDSVVRERARRESRLGSGHRIRTCLSGFRDQRPAS